MACRNSKANKHTQVTLIRLLLQRGLDVNTKDEGLCTPLHLLCNYYGSHTKAIDLLLHYKANVNVKDKSSWSPLHFLCLNHGKNTDAIALLLKHKADPNAKTIGAYTPVHHLCLGFSDSLPSLRALIVAGGHVTLQSRAGETAYEIAKEKRHKAQSAYMEKNHLTGRE